MENVAVLALPGYLLVGSFVGDLTTKVAGVYRWALAGVVILFGLLLYYNIVRYSRLVASSEDLFGPSYYIFLLMAGFLFVLIAILFVWNRSAADAYQGTVYGLLAVLVFFTWGTTWSLTQYHANDTRERIIINASDDEVPLMANTIQEVSRQTRNSDKNLEILMTVDSPALRWYLRDFDNLVVDAALPRTINSEALITSMESTPSLETGYVGADFGYYRPNTEHILTVPAALQWWFFRKSPVTINEERAIFSLRADLAGANFQVE
jgi:hypothetical protein